MQTRIVHSMICVSLICAVGSSIGAPQDGPKLNEMKDSQHPVLLASQDPLELKLCAEPCYAAAPATVPQDAPEVKKKVEPYYPELLMKAGIEGKVWLKVFIDENGGVEKALVEKSTHSALSEAALNAIKQWEFSPAKKDGKPIKSEVTIPFIFKLADKPDKAKLEIMHRLEEDVYKLLRGEARDSLKSHIGADARAIVGNKYEQLSSLFSDKGKRDLLVEGPDCKIKTVRIAVGDAGDMAYLLLMTQPASGKAERWHTVVFEKSPDGKWTISAWHAGS